MKQIIEENPYYAIAFSTFFIIFSIFVFDFFNAPDAVADAIGFCWDFCTGSNLPYHPEDFSSFPCGCFPPFST